MTDYQRGDRRHSETGDRVGSAAFVVIGSLWVAFALICAGGSFSDHMYVSGLFWLLASVILAPIPALSGWLADKGIGRGWRFGIAGGALVIGLAMIGATAPENRSVPVAARSSAPAPAVTAAPAVAAAAVDTRKSDFLVVYRQVLSTAAPCDKASAHAASLLQQTSRGRATMVDAYSAAKDGQAACETAWMALNDIKPPESLTGDNKEQAAKALESCATAYFTRKKSLETMMEIIDGDMRPSRVAGFKEDVQGAQGLTMLCVAGMMGAGTELGIDAKELSRES